MANKKSPGAPATFNAELKAMGLPAQPGELHVISQFRDGDSRNNIPLQGAPGEYQVTFVFARPGFSLLPEGRFSFANALEGDSHLAITKPAFVPPNNPDATEIRIYGRTDDGEFVFTGYPNERGFLGKVTSAPFRALNRNDAKLKAYRAIAGSLSNWSVHLDIPIEISQVDTTELLTGSAQMSFANPFWEAPFSVTPTMQLKPEFRGYASLYREALGSSSIVYRFLCMYKILEGLRARRTRLDRQTRKQGQVINRPMEVLPDKAEIPLWLDGIFPVRRPWDELAISEAVPEQVRKKEFSDVIDSVLKPLRDNVAHALSSASGELTMSVDELLHIEQLGRWLSLTKCMVRRMLKNEFPSEFLSYLRDDGTIVT